jgi:hypothetical protein
MKKICAWCKKEPGGASEKENDAISHGICEDCAAKMRNELAEMKKEDKKEDGEKKIPEVKFPIK